MQFNASDEDEYREQVRRRNLMGMCRAFSAMAGFAKLERLAELVKDASPVRIQWDPERDLRLNRLDHRSIQVGLGPGAVDQNVNAWITAITAIPDAPVTALAIAMHLAQDDIGTARTLLPAERPYPLEAAVAARIGATTAVP